MRPGKRRTLEPGSPEYMAEKLKASVRAKVEHPFLRVKRFSVTARCATEDRRRTGSVWLLLGLGNLLTAESQLAGGGVCSSSAFRPPDG